MDACEEFKAWDGQSEPTVRHQRGKPLVTATKVNDVIGKGPKFFFTHVEESKGRWRSVVCSTLLRRFCLSLCVIHDELPYSLISVLALINFF